MEAPSTPSAEAESEFRCDICDGLAFETHCKIVCRRCGYTRDCGDP